MTKINHVIYKMEIIHYFRKKNIVRSYYFVNIFNKCDVLRPNFWHIFLKCTHSDGALHQKRQDKTNQKSFGNRSSRLLYRIVARLARYIYSKNCQQKWLLFQFLSHKIKQFSNDWFLSSHTRFSGHIEIEIPSEWLLFELFLSAKNHCLSKVWR